MQCDEYTAVKSTMKSSRFLNACRDCRLPRVDGRDFDLVSRFASTWASQDGRQCTLQTARHPSIARHSPRVDGSDDWKPEERQHQTFFYFAGLRTTKVVTLCHSLPVRVAHTFRCVSRFFFEPLNQSNEISMPHDSHRPADSEIQPHGTAESDSPVPKVNIAWLQLRMGWPTVGKIRLDQEKKDAIARSSPTMKRQGLPIVLGPNSIRCFSDWKKSTPCDCESF
jgi:hypothetical protein